MGKVATRRKKAFSNKTPTTTTQELARGGCLTRSSEVAGEAGNPKGKPLMELPDKDLLKLIWQPSSIKISQLGPPRTRRLRLDRDQLCLLARQHTGGRSEREMR
ncbi:hypothetical protein MTO96_002095 [Rhipicephalus appendiculatus]